MILPEGAPKLSSIDIRGSAVTMLSPSPIAGDPTGVLTAETEVGVTVGVAVIGGDSPSIDTGRLKFDSCIDVRYRCVLGLAAKASAEEDDSGTASGLERDAGGKSVLKDDGGAKVDVEAFLARSEVGDKVPVGDVPPSGVAGTDNVERTELVIMLSCAIEDGRAVCIIDWDSMLPGSLVGSV